MPMIPKQAFNVVVLPAPFFPMKPIMSPSSTTKATVQKAVSNLSFVVEDGDIMGFIGKNGAGKTTTLKACLGIIGIDEGEILLDGTSVLKEPMACKRKMAYVPDNPQLDEYMTGLQYLNFICDIYEVPSKMWPLAFLLAVPVVVILYLLVPKGDRHTSVFELVVEEAFL